MATEAAKGLPNELLGGPTASTGSVDLVSKRCAGQALKSALANIRP